MKANCEKIKLNASHNISLEIEIYHAQTSNGTGLLFFYGGGWIKDNKYRFRGFAADLAKKGYTVFLPDYRCFEKHGTSPAAAVEDAICAAELCLTQLASCRITRLAVGGASAGGHLALCLSVIERFRRRHGAVFYKCVLFNPVTRVAELSQQYMEETKLVLKDEGICPTQDGNCYDVPLLVMHGTKDQLVSFEGVKNFIRNYQIKGGVCQLEPYSGRGHAFHLESVSREDYLETLGKIDSFLKMETEVG